MMVQCHDPLIIGVDPKFATAKSLRTVALAALLDQAVLKSFDDLFSRCLRVPNIRFNVAKMLQSIIPVVDSTVSGEPVPSIMFKSPQRGGCCSENAHAKSKIRFCVSLLLQERPPLLHCCAIWYLLSLSIGGPVKSEQGQGHSISQSPLGLDV